MLFLVLCHENSEKSKFNSFQIFNLCMIRGVVLCTVYQFDLAPKLIFPPELQRAEVLIFQCNCGWHLLVGSMDKCARFSAPPKTASTPLLITSQTQRLDFP